MFSAMPFGFLFIFVFVFGSVMSLSSLHWLGIWVGLEVNLMGFIPILVYRGIVQETESGMKYFIVQALGSGMIMLGSLMSFNVSLSWETVSFLHLSSGLVILIFGLMLKLGSFPFHFWLPSVMAGISWMGCLVLTTWQKVAPMFLLSSLLYNWDNSSFYGMSFLIIIAGFSSIVGGVGGLNQTQIRALLAYSSIGHVGWMLFCGAVSESALKIYFFVYFMTSICVFMVLWCFENSLYSQIGSLGSEKSKVNEFCLIFMLLSLGGMPPLLGFIGKWLAIWSSCSGYFPGCIFPLLAGSLISLFYYLSLLFSLMFFSGSSLSSNSNQLGNLNVNFSLSEEENNIWVSGASLSKLQGSYKLLIINSILVLNLAGGILISLSLLLSDFA
uniref:NADH-ubiquinone oxidoreductase chain 2 n=1 Tax=Bolma rugosa TaxID=335776 RepID=A0A0X9PCH5_9VEST|nr:NADH dehydrogenase subunit 2 [Bolma rugosa]AMA07330.1 NADH dehydrogenase subunit 2 [Bolma rugosa]